jgi:hypothetical protein
MRNFQHKDIGTAAVSTLRKLEELRIEIAKGWDGRTSKRNVKDIIAAKTKAF